MNLMFDSWRDALEILFFSTVFYHITHWLKRDTTRNLLPYFYGILGIGLVSHICSLATVSYFLFLFAPSVVALFILMHQDTLERNIVAVKNITSAHIPSSDWIEILLRVCLSKMNNNRAITCVIENNDSLSPFLECLLPFHASLSENVLDLILDSTLINNERMVWIRHNGTLQGANTSWKHVRQHPPEYRSNNAHLWKYDAQLYTSKTDCLVLHTNPAQRSFTLIAEGVMSENIPTHLIANHLEKHISKLAIARKKGVFHAFPQTYAARQRTP